MLSGNEAPLAQAQGAAGVGAAAVVERPGLGTRFSRKRERRR